MYLFIAEIRNLFQCANAFDKVLFNRGNGVFQAVFVLGVFGMSLIKCLLMADVTATGKNITAGHFQIVVNGFQPVLQIHCMLFYKMDRGDIRSGERRGGEEWRFWGVAGI